MLSCGTVILTTAALLMCFSSAEAKVSTVRNRTALVDTRIGTGGGGWGIAMLNPGPQVPFGAMRLGPDTSIGLEPFRLRFDDHAGYYYFNNYMECLSHTHIVGAGEGDFQNFGVMVVREWNNNIIQDCNYRSLYTHTEEVALPGYYAVELLTHNTYAELAVSGTHSGIHRYACRSQWPSPGPTPCVLIIDICHGVTRDMSNLNIGQACIQANIVNISTADGGLTYEIDAWIFNEGEFSSSSNRGGIDIYFHGVLTAEIIDASDGSQPRPVEMTQAMWMNKTVRKGWTSDKTASGSLGLGFMVAESNSTVEFILRAGISFVSSSNARLNLNTQQRPNGGPWMTFEQAVQQTVNSWEAQLGAITYSGGVADSDWHVRVFEAALFHTTYPPTTYSEVNGQFMGEDWNVHTVQPGSRYFSDLSIWDIYRTQAPLLGFTHPAAAKDLANSMMFMYHTTGDLPVWPFANVETYCMVGHHSAIILGDYIMRNLGGINTTDIFEAVVKSIKAQSVSQLQQYGYVTFEANQRGASLTLDYALDAGAVMHLANFLGNSTVAALMKTFAEDYKNQWDFNTTYFCPKFANGTFWCQPPLDPYPFEVYYTEGNSAEYRWYVPHDLRGLVSLFPSKDDFAQQLNEFFEIAYLWPLNTTLPNWAFWAGNEPDILTQVQFNFAGNEYAHLTQYWFPTLLDTWYYPYASGIPGNDDYGTMSAWAVWGYVGMYPVSSTDEYALFTPRFDSIDFNVSPDEFPFSPWRSSVSGSNSSMTTILQIRCYNRPAAGTAYVANISVNGVPLATPIVKHQQLLATTGGKPTLLEFYLSGEPSVFGEQLPSLGGPAPFIPKHVELTAEMKDILQRVTDSSTPAAAQELRRRHRAVRMS